MENSYKEYWDKKKIQLNGLKNLNQQLKNLKINVYFMTMAIQMLLIIAYNLIL